jgi:5'-deoxynucleotidase YfbR-like HD superfamily hydrolase
VGKKGGGVTHRAGATSPLAKASEGGSLPAMATLPLPPSPSRRRGEAATTTVREARRSKEARAVSSRAWQRMLSGRRLDLLDPSALDIEIEDIAHGLARVARWNGQTSGAHIFSVAQHSLLVEALARARVPRLDPGRRLAILLHDAPEYVIGDMISPFKAVIGDAYKAVERRLLTAIHRRFGLPEKSAPELEKLIKAADREAAFLEATRLAGFAAAEARRFFGRPPVFSAAIERDYLKPWPAETAERRYLVRFRKLVID